MLKLRIAWRYIFSRKSHSVINLLSVVSVIAVAVPVSATVFVVSLHNGLAEMIYGMYGQFDSQVKIVSEDGVFFNPEDVDLSGLNFVKVQSEVIEQGVLVESAKGQSVAFLRGVDSHYVDVVEIDSLVTHGSFELTHGDLDEVVLGQGLAYDLGVNVALNEAVTIYSLNSLPMVAMPIFNYETAFPSGVYTLDKATDSKYLFSSLEQARRLLGKDSLVSSIEVRLVDGVNVDDAIRQIKGRVGERFLVKGQIEQRDALFKIINIEKWITMMLLGVIIFIAALSLVGSIVIMVAEKRRQNVTLLQLGYTTSNIRQIYNCLGISISAIGLFCGIVLGVGLSLIQQRWGVLSLGSDNLVIDAYPINIVFWDIVAIFTLVLLITSVITYVTTRTVKIDKIEN